MPFKYKEFIEDYNNQLLKSSHKKIFPYLTRYEIEQFLEKNIHL